MHLETRFSVIIALCFAFGVCASGYISWRLETRQARDEIKQKADMFLETALAVRVYTSEQVSAAVQANQASTDFNPVQVPSFAAQSALRGVQAKFPEFRYRESSLNPTNVNDRATDWEVSLLRQFQAEPDRTELAGEIGDAGKRQYFVARPIRVRSPACLRCHSVPSAAPKAMLTQYGESNGFGWKMNDLVGMQLVQVATAASDSRALNSVIVTIGSLTSVFVLSAAVMLLLLRRHVTHPLAALTRVALATSLDKADAAPSPVAGHGQFEELQRAIFRLRSSVDHALKMMQRAPDSRATRPHDQDPQG